MASVYIANVLYIVYQYVRSNSNWKTFLQVFEGLDMFLRLRLDLVSG